MIDGRTRLLALIGHPVEHSLSPAMHNAAFTADGLNFAYVALDVKPEHLPEAVEGAAALGFRGFNVTMPHKKAMIPLLQDLDETARISGAVNTAVIEGSKLRGYNTDGYGMVMACKEAGVPLASRDALLLGAGGAAAAIALAFGREGVGGLRIVSRSLETATNLSERLRAAGLKQAEAYPPDALVEAAREAEVVVNATSLGMRDEDPLPVPAEHLGEGRAVCDAVYRPGKETRLIHEARARGARVVPGQRMLLYQGVLAQKLWTGLDPNVAAMSEVLS